MKLLPFPDELPDGMFPLLANWMRGQGDPYQTAQAAYMVEGYLIGHLLGGPSAPQPFTPGQGGGFSPRGPGVVGGSGTGKDFRPGEGQDVTGQSMAGEPRRPPTLGETARESVRSMTAAECADYLDHVGSQMGSGRDAPGKHVGATGTLNANSGMNWGNVWAIIRRIIDSIINPVVVGQPAAELE